MKSFADWTDEIRLLMNPPKPAPYKLNRIDFNRPRDGWVTRTISQEEFRRQFECNWGAYDTEEASLPCNKVVAHRPRLIGKTAAMAAGARMHHAVQQAFELSERHGKAWVGFDTGAGDDYLAVVVRDFDGKVIHHEILR